MKKLLLFLLFSSLLFSYTFNSILTGATLTTDVSVTNSLTVSASANKVVSGNPNNLQSGDIVCEGNVNIYSKIDGSWANSQFVGYSLYYLDKPFYNWNERIPHNTVWLTKNNLNSVIQNMDNYDQYESDLPGEAWVFNLLGGSLVAGFEEPFNYKQSLLDASFSHTNKKGYANVFCGGTYLVKKGATTLATRELTQAYSGFSTSTSLLEGTHTISNQFQVSDSKCFAAMRLPLSSPFDTILLYRRNPMTINSNSQSVTLTVVGTPTFDFSNQGLYSVFPDINSPPPFCYGPDQTSRILKAVITNEGELEGEVTNVVSNTPGFIVSKITDDWVFADG
ncbi:MAG: hypothetical protein PHU63_02690, partial [Candidatus ainarchaeum sp.]|nr:hypothetical protein [Candidatus ainarchaeum sp.]